MTVQRAFRFLAFGFLLLVIPVVLSSPSAAQIGVGISVQIGPPALPVYEQPICPSPGYMWTPGYWAWDDGDGYYWVPGTWVEAPEPGLLWTPGYWGWNNGVYAWNGGYWGTQIGFYGGINYGFGYGGNGFYGGEWRNGAFFYNTAVMHVNTTQITNVYVNRTVIVNNNSHVAFNGGQGGVAVRPTAEQEAYAHERHTPPVAAQVQQEHAASQNRALFASTNHGRPAVAATARPGEFSGKGVVAARAAGGTYHAPKMSPKEAREAPGNRAGEARPAENRPAANRPAEKRPAAEPRATESRPAANREKPAEHAAPKPASRPATSNAARENNTRANNTREAAPREPASHASAPKPKAEPKESAPRESAPKAAKPAAAPHESAPKAAKPAPAPRAEKPAAPPKRESAPPKEEPKGR